MKPTKQQENELAITIEDAIDAYCKAGCKNFFVTMQKYDLGYEIKLSIKKKKWHNN